MLADGDADVDVDVGVATAPVVAGSDGVAVDDGVASVATAAGDAAGWSVLDKTDVAVPAVVLPSESAEVSVWRSTSNAALRSGTLEANADPDASEFSRNRPED